MTSAPDAVRRILATVLLALVLASGGALAQQPVLRDPDVRVDRVGGYFATSPATRPKVVLQGDKAFAVYLDRRYFVATEPYFTVSVNQGGTWNTTDRRLNNEPAGFPEGDMGSVLVRPGPDGRIYRLYTTNDGPLSVPYVRTSPDGGQSWPTESS